MAKVGKRLCNTNTDVAKNSNSSFNTIADFTIVPKSISTITLFTAWMKGFDLTSDLFLKHKVVILLFLCEVHRVVNVLHIVVKIDIFAAFSRGQLSKKDYNAPEQVAAIYDGQNEKLK